jgi:putative transposase
MSHVVGPEGGSLGQVLSFERFRSPPDVIRQAVWLYSRFTLSLRAIEEPLAPRDIEVSYETVRAWGIRFAPRFAANLRRQEAAPERQLALGRLAMKIRGERMGGSVPSRARG